MKRDSENLYEALAAVGLEYDHKDNSVGTFKGRNVMFAPHSMILFIGEKDFDRWANSTEFEFDLSTPKGCRALLKCIGKAL